MGPPDPPANFLPTHVVFQVMPWPFSSNRMGFIQDNGTAFMSPYLMPLVSLPGTAPSPLGQLGGIPHGQWAAPSAAIYDLGGTSCVPGGGALHPLTPHDTTFMGPCLGGIPYRQRAGPSAAICNLGGTSCVPGGSALRAPAPMTLLSRGLVARIQKRIFLGCTSAMGFDWWPCTLLSSMGAFWLSVIFFPWQLLCSVVLASSWGVFILLLSFSSSYG